MRAGRDACIVAIHWRCSHKNVKKFDIKILHKIGSVDVVESFGEIYDTDC